MQLIGFVTSIFLLTKKVPVIFHSLRGYDSHLIIKEFEKFDVKIDLIPYGLEKYMAFTKNNLYWQYATLQFMNASLEKLVKNLSDNGFKYLTQKFCSKYLEFLKQKDIHPYEYVHVLKDFVQKHCLIKNILQIFLRWSNWW